MPRSPHVPGWDRPRVRPRTLRLWRCWKQLAQAHPVQFRKSPGGVRLMSETCWVQLPGGLLTGSAAGNCGGPLKRVSARFDSELPHHLKRKASLRVILQGGVPRCQRGSGGFDARCPLSFADEAQVGRAPVSYSEGLRVRPPSSALWFRSSVWKSTPLVWERVRVRCPSGPFAPCRRLVRRCTPT